VIPADTSPEAYAAQARWMRRLDPGARLRLAMDLCDEMRAMCADGVRRRHPEFGEGQVSEEVGRIVLEIAPKFA
jgi:hypothetical protein